MGLPLMRRWKGRFALLLALTCFALLWWNMRLPDDRHRTESRAFTDTADARLATLASGLRTAGTAGESGVRVLADGRDAFVARAALAREATRGIDLQYYMYHQDTIGRLLLSELLDAADRGVRIRILLDDLYRPDGIATWSAIDAHPFVEVRFFNPFALSTFRWLEFVTRPRAVNHRMHSKSFTVDNQASVLGGRNIGDEYFDATPDLAFSDLDVLTVGAAVSEVSDQFDQYWNSPLSYPATTLEGSAESDALETLRRELAAFRVSAGDSPYVRSLRESDLAVAIRNRSVTFHRTTARVIHDVPDKAVLEARAGNGLLISQLSPVALSATREVILISPYFVPTDRSVEAICGLAGRGVRVRVLTNSLGSNDVVAVHAGYARHRVPLLRCGVELHELSDRLTEIDKKRMTWLPGLSRSSLHAKSMVIDRTQVFIGSFNFDARSLFLNNEIGLLFEDPDIGGGMAAAFDEKIDSISFRVTLRRGEEALEWAGRRGGVPVIYTSEPNVGAGLRLWVAVLGALPIESLL